MRIVLAALAVASLAAPAFASCVGSGAVKSCSDASGNSYSVTHVGNSTFVNGSNSQTGSTWNQSSTRAGSNTFTNGTDSDGHSWNAISTPYGTSGTNSDGDSFSDPN